MPKDIVYADIDTLSAEARQKLDESALVLRSGQPYFRRFTSRYYGPSDSLGTTQPGG